VTEERSKKTAGKGAGKLKKREKAKKAVERLEARCLLLSIRDPG
jgi:hypothetical protein